MTDPLARIEAMIATLGSREARFWTPSDTCQEQVPNAGAQENCGFGQFGHFGHPTGNTIGDDLVGEHENAPDGDRKDIGSLTRVESYPGSCPKCPKPPRP